MDPGSRLLLQLQTGTRGQAQSELLAILFIPEWLSTLSIQDISFEQVVAIVHHAIFLLPKERVLVLDTQAVDLILAFVPDVPLPSDSTLVPAATFVRSRGLQVSSRSSRERPPSDYRERLPLDIVSRPPVQGPTRPVYQHGV